MSTFVQHFHAFCQLLFQNLSTHCSTIMSTIINYYLYSTTVHCQPSFYKFIRYSQSVKCQPFYTLFYTFFQLLSTTIQYTFSTKSQPLFAHLTHILHSTLLTHLITFVNPFHTLN